MLDLDKVIRQMGLVKKTVDVHGQRIELRDKVRWIRMSQFRTYEYHHSFDEQEPWKSVIITSRRTSPPAPAVEVLPVQQLPIKLADVKKQLKFIPVTHHALYSGLTGHTSVTEVRELDSEAESVEDVAHLSGQVSTVECLYSENWTVSCYCEVL